MAARRIIPIRVIELQLDKDEMLRRGMKDKMTSNRSESSSEWSSLLLYIDVCSVCLHDGPESMYTT